MVFAGLASGHTDMRMLYLAYERQAGLLELTRTAARSLLTALSPWDKLTGHPLRYAAAAGALLARAGLTHHRPAYGIGTVVVGNRDVPVTEEAVCATPFGTLLHFKKDVVTPQPRMLVVAPLSGHFATLLRNTVRTLLADHDVYITDWHNARDISPADGAFGFADYVDHVIRFLEEIGPGAHVLGVCQPCVQVLAAVALMAEDQHPAQPCSMTLMAGPVDTRVSPTKVNELATGRPLSWFQRHLIDTVPPPYRGAGRRVYPGFMQLLAFMSMNANRHVKAHVQLFELLAAGESAEAEAIKAFYDEYFAVLDLPAEFYLETVEHVFQEALLARGLLTVRGRRVDPRAIRRTALLTVEGERDDICSVGQTMAAHDLCTSLRPYLKRHHLQPGAGHYGVFSGTRWETQIYPVVRNFVLASD
jgi:poly(3-hydroxybutyrate) depolymerase